MKRLIAASCFAVSPFYAAAECAAIWEEIVVFAGPLGEGISQASVTDAPDDWCAVSVTFDANPVDAAFRIDHLAAASEDARSIEMVLSNVDTRFGAFDVTANLSHDVTSGTLQLHTLSARLHGPDNGPNDGRALRGRGTFGLGAFREGDDLQSVLPGLMVRDVSAAISVTPALLQELNVDLSDVTRVAINDALRGISETQVNRRARNEFLRFAGAAPNARGTLDVTLNMSEGTNVMNVIGSFSRLRGDVEISEALAAALSNATLDLVWKPGRM